MFGSGKDKHKNLSENEVRIVLPEEQFTVMEWTQEGLPCVAALNSALTDFEPKRVFGWHLSLIVDFEELADNGMPSHQEREVVDPFCDQLNDEIKAGGNALFVIRENWNKTRRMVWRVYDPEIAHQHLQYILEHHKYPRQFDYHMQEDFEWEQISWYFSQLRK